MCSHANGAGFIDWEEVRQMKTSRRIVRYVIIIVATAVLFVGIRGIPMQDAKLVIKAYGTEVDGRFTGTRSLIGTKEGTFTADTGWRFAGTINPDGGLWMGKLVNFPIPAEWRENSIHDLPAIYTGALEEGVLTDVTLK